MNRTEKIDEIKKQKYFIRNDIFIFIILAVLILALTGSVFLIKQKKGNEAYIYSDGELIKIMPLDNNDVYLYEYKGHYNKIVVDSGYVFVEDSDCDDKVCVYMGKINKIGDSIICLPHKLVIKIKGEGENPADL